MYSRHANVATQAVAAEPVAKSRPITDRVWKQMPGAGSLKIIMLALAATSLAAAGLAQVPPEVAAPAINMLRAGTAIRMKTAVPLTTKGKQVRVGQRVPLEVAETVWLDGQIIIPAGAPGMAEIVTVRNKGMWGKSGGISVRILYIRVGDRQIHTTGNFADRGETGTLGVVAAVSLMPIAGFFTTGTSAEIPLGSAVTAYLNEDFSMSVRGTGNDDLIQSAPSLIPPAMPAPTVASATPMALSARAGRFQTRP